MESVSFVPNAMCMYVHAMVCVHVYGGGGHGLSFFLYMSQKELAVDQGCHGHVVFIQSKCEECRGKEGSALGLGLLGRLEKRGLSQRPDALSAS